MFKGSFTLGHEEKHRSFPAWFSRRQVRNVGYKRCWLASNGCLVFRENFEPIRPGIDLRGFCFVIVPMC